MGTRSLTKVLDEDGKIILNLYRQMDGYPDCHGLELAEYLKGHSLINGIGMGRTWDDSFNGAGCMAASIVAHFKNCIGSFYIQPTDAKDCGQEFDYIVSGVGSAIQIEVHEVRMRGRKKLYVGSAEGLIAKFNK